MNQWTNDSVIVEDLKGSMNFVYLSNNVNSQEENSLIYDQRGSIGFFDHPCSRLGKGKNQIKSLEQ